MVRGRRRAEVLRGRYPAGEISQSDERETDRGEGLGRGRTIAGGGGGHHPPWNHCGFDDGQGRLPPRIQFVRNSVACNRLVYRIRRKRIIFRDLLMIFLIGLFLLEIKEIVIKRIVINLSNRMTMIGCEKQATIAFLLVQCLLN
jgi:hypothetical protein